MKLALIVPGGFDPGGRENTIPALLGLTRELARRHEVHVFAFGGPGGVTRYPLVGATIHQLGDASRVDPPRFARSSRLLARFAWQLARELVPASVPVSFDVLHAFWASEPGLLTGLLGRMARIPVVVSIGGGEAAWIPDIRYGGAGSALRRRMTRVSLRCAREITVGSAFARAFLNDRDAARARVVPLGISCEDFDAPAARPAGPPWRLLHVGSITPVKDHGTLLAAFAAVASRLGDVTLDCVGEDTLNGQFAARAQAMGLASRVTFWGFLPNDELAGLYRRAHLHLVTSRYESQGVVILEAGAASLPTVGTDVGLLRTLAPDAAVTVPVRDAAGMADAICALLSDEPRRRAMGAAAQEFARRHDVASTAQAFERIYDQWRNTRGDGGGGGAAGGASTPAPSLARVAVQGVTVWLTGRPASGKTTISVALEEALQQLGIETCRIDGDILRAGRSRDLGFSRADRAENATRAAHLAIGAARAGQVAIVGLVTPYAADRQAVRDLHDSAGLRFVEVHVACPLSLAIARDPKGLYARARSGQLEGLTGLGAPYEVPEAPDLTLDTSSLSVDEETRRLLDCLRALAVVNVSR